MIIIPDYSGKGVDKAMLVREVILRAVSGDYKWIQAADILGYSPRHMSRIKKRYEEYGYDGLFDRRTRTGPRLIKMEVLEEGRASGFEGFKWDIRRAALREGRGSLFFKRRVCYGLRFIGF